MKCNYCGEEIANNVKHCPYCRAQVLDFEEQKDETKSNETKQDETHFKSTSKPKEKQNNGLSQGIIAIFFSYISPLVSIILGSIGLSEAKKAKETANDARIGITINTLAIIIASISILYSILKTIMVIVYGTFGEFVWKEIK